SGLPGLFIFIPTSMNVKHSGVKASATDAIAAGWPQRDTTELAEFKCAISLCDDDRLAFPMEPPDGASARVLGSVAEAGYAECYTAPESYWIDLRYVVGATRFPGRPRGHGEDRRRSPGDRHSRFRA